jgi:hypothetical protein
MATDLVVAVSDRATDGLGVLFQSDEGQKFLAARKGVPAETVAALSALGFSGICNVLAAIKTAKYYDLGPKDVIVTIATDDARMYGSERDKILRRDFDGRFDQVAAAETYGRHLAGAATDRLLELSFVDKNRIFNLGYFTWVEQQGVSVAEFEARRRPEFWRGLRELLPVWDEMIAAFNRKVGSL